MIRSAYEEILAEWPLLYGYWKKYAEFEGYSNFEKAKQIYERGVKSVTPSVDLWTHYCVYVAEKSQNLDEIRR
jgi:pre-mRNA-processing factor 39